MFHQYKVSNPEDYLVSSQSFESQRVEKSSRNLLQIQQLEKIQDQSELLLKILQNCSILRNKNQQLKLNQQVEGQYSECRAMTRNQSKVSIFSLSYDLNNFSFSREDRLKFGGQGSKCLREVKQKCSAQTYQYLVQVVEEGRKQVREKQMRAKDKKTLETVSEKNIMLQHEVTKYKDNVAQLRQKIQKLSKENGDIFKKVNEVQNLQKRMLKKQEALLYQRKICNNLQKEIKKEMGRLEEMYENIDRNENSSCNSCSVKIIADSNEQSSADSSKSTLDRSRDKMECSELWMALHKLEDLCRVLQV